MVSAVKAGSAPGVVQMMTFVSSNRSLEPSPSDAVLHCVELPSFEPAFVAAAAVGVIWPRAKLPSTSESFWL